MSVPQSEHFQFPLTISLGAKSLAGRSSNFLNSIVLLKLNSDLYYMIPKSLYLI